MDTETLEKLLEIGKQLSKNRSLDPVLQYAMSVAIDLVGAERGYLLWLTEDDSFVFKVRLDCHGQEIDMPEEQISHTILAQVIEDRKPLVLQDAIVDPHFQHAESVTALKLRSVMVVPLISKNKILGALYVENRSAKSVFVDEDIHPLEFLASQVTIAIENAILNDDLEQRVVSRTRDLKQAFQQVEQSLEDAVELDRVRTASFAMVAHDIRAPLATIVFAMNMLREDLEGVMDEAQKSWLDTCLRMTAQVDQLTKDFLDLLSAQIGKLEVLLEPVNLEGLLVHQYQINRSGPWPGGVDFVLDLEPDLPEVLCDPNRIQQVVTNLISNAVKYTVQGSITLYAHRCPHEKDCVLIGVSDTGVGIGENDLERVFNRFEQIGETGRKKNGLGLGLAICRELIERHQGQIWVESTLGQGSNFMFTLPIAR